jgi:hypothetical protein
MLRVGCTTRKLSLCIALALALVMLLPSATMASGCISINTTQPVGQIHIGFLGLQSFWPSLSSVVQIAVDTINREKVILPNTELKVTIYDTQFNPAVCSVLQGAGRTMLALLLCDTAAGHRCDLFNIACDALID